MPKASWDADSIYCPYGHLRHICEQKSGGAGRTCRIHEIEKTEDEARRSTGRLAGVRTRYATPEVERMMRAREFAVAPDCSKTGLTLLLECTHNTYQRHRNFMISELMYCDKCEDWYHIIQITHNRTGYIQQVNLRLPRMTPLHSRPNSVGSVHLPPEAPPIDPAIIERNNMAGRERGSRRGSVRIRRFG